MFDNNKGRLFVISAPSGAGKSTLCSMMIKRFPNIKYSISYTSRAPRGKEINGVDYFFVSRQEFKRMIDSGEFIEWAEVHGNLYGTSLKTISKSISSGTDIFLDIDPQGARILKSRFDDAVFIFITARSFNILHERLVLRGTDSEETIELRLKNAREEIEYYRDYDYLIVNDDSETAFIDIMSIYRAEKLKTKYIAKTSDFMQL